MSDPGGRRPRRLPLVPILLAVLALLDLRAELQLLVDHFTFASLVEIPRHHPLAIAVLLFTPWMVQRSR
jgi:hypothetical protein